MYSATMMLRLTSVSRLRLVHAARHVSRIPNNIAVETWKHAICVNKRLQSTSVREPRLVEQNADSALLANHLESVSEFEDGITPLVDVGPASVVVSYETGAGAIKTLQFLHVWLRDSCRCPKCIHATSGQKMHSSAEIPLDIKPLNVAAGKEHIRVFWPDTKNRVGSHESIYPLSWLIEQSKKDIETGLGVDSIFKPKLWDASNVNISPISYDSLSTTLGKRAMLGKLRDFGICFIEDIPLSNPKKEFDDIVHLIGPNRETFYGRTWDVKSVKGATNIAYTNEFLGFHMDLMYYKDPPGLQYLFSIKNEVTGGTSMFSDIFHAVNIMRTVYPAEYETLCKVNVTFQYFKDGHAMRYKRPTIMPSRYADGAPEVFFSPPFMGPLECNPLDAAKFYKAYHILNTIISDKKNMITTRLKPGTCVIFHNTRVLHGRTAFDPTEGDRHFLGTYVAWDNFLETFRVTM